MIGLPRSTCHRCPAGCRRRRLASEPRGSRSQPKSSSIALPTWRSRSVAGPYGRETW